MVVAPFLLHCTLIFFSDADYTIWVWRQQQSESELNTTPTLHLHNPSRPLPSPPEYLNPAFYIFNPSRAHHPDASGRLAPSPRPKSTRSRRTKGSSFNDDGDDSVPKFRREFDRFHSENGVRTVIGSIGPVQNGKSLHSTYLLKVIHISVRMLLKSSHRHVYISRKFAMRHGFIPNDTTPGNYGYSGLVNIGTWPITLKNSTVAPTSTTSIVVPRNDRTLPSAPSTLTLPLSTPPASVVSPIRTKHPPKQSATGPKVTNVAVYLSEEPHFDVVLGRSFFEKRQIRTSPIDPTDIVCLDTGEKIECELVILKDGKGEIVTVT